MVALTAGTETSPVLNNVNKIKADSNGFNLKSKGGVILEGPSMKVQTNASPVTYSAATGLVAVENPYNGTNRLMIMTAGTGTAARAGQAITLAFTYTAANSYTVVATYSQITATAEAITVSRTAANSFTVYGDAKDYNWIAVGY